MWGLALVLTLLFLKGLQGQGKEAQPGVSGGEAGLGTGARRGSGTLSLWIVPTYVVTCKCESGWLLTAPGGLVRTERAGPGVGGP